MIEKVMKFFLINRIRGHLQYKVTLYISLCMSRYFGVFLGFILLFGEFSGWGCGSLWCVLWVVWTCVVVVDLPSWGFSRARRSGSVS